MTWHGDNPFYLMIFAGGERIVIDLDERGWATTYAAYMRAPGYWFLFRKDAEQHVFEMIVLDGEQPYYTRRTVGIAGSGGSNDVAFYGIGKKRLDGHVDRLWYAPDGAIIAGDDVDQFGVEYVKRLGPKPVLEEVSS